MSGGFPGAVASEWTKTWSVRTTWWNLVAGALLMAATAAQLAVYTANTNTNDDATDDQGVVQLGSLAVQSVDLVQFVLIALAMLMITAEYSNGSMRTSLQWVPRRGALLLAKTLVAAVVCGAVGTVLGVVGTAAASPILGEWGTFTFGGWLGDVLLTGLYLALIGVFTLGLATALRSAVATLVVVFLTLAVIPISLQSSGIDAFETVADYLPGVAGTAFIRGLDEAYPPAAGLLILVAWVAAALALGYTVLRRRDA